MKSAADVAASNPGALTFSLALPLAPLDWSGLSLAVGVAVAEGLEAALPAPVTTSSIQLKWPNDLWLGDAKLGGILIETGPVPPQASASKTARFVVVGIGLNIGAPPAGDYRTPPACLRQLWPDATAVAALSAIAVPMLDALLAFGASGFAPFASRFACRDLLLGRELALSDGSTGIGDGLAADGALRLRRADGSRHEVRSDEVSVRPVGSGAAHLPTTFHAAVSGQATKEPVGEAQEPAREVIAAGARRGA